MSEPLTPEGIADGLVPGRDIDGAKSALRRQIVAALRAYGEQVRAASVDAALTFVLSRGSGPDWTARDLYDAIREVACGTQKTQTEEC